jgi:hypothetical protein
MTIVHTFDKDGAFIAGDTRTRLTSYAIDDRWVVEARENAMKAAKGMLKCERASPDRAEYDRRNWESLDATTEVA